MICLAEAEAGAEAGAGAGAEAEAEAEAEGGGGEAGAEAEADFFLFKSGGIISEQFPNTTQRESPKGAIERCRVQRCCRSLVLSGFEATPPSTYSSLYPSIYICLPCPYPLFPPRWCIAAGFARFRLFSAYPRFLFRLQSLCVSAFTCAHDAVYIGETEMV